MGNRLGEMVRMELGPIASGLALIGILFIMIILLAVLALVVVKALGASPWGNFTVFVRMRLLICTFYAGWQKLFSDDPAISFLGHTAKYRSQLGFGQILGPAKTLEQMQQIIFNDTVDAVFCGSFMFIVLGIFLIALVKTKSALKKPNITAIEGPFEREIHAV